MDCGARASENAACPRCAASPLLDLREPNVREMLVEDDARRASSRNDRVRWLSVVASMVLVALVSIAFPTLGLVILGVLPFFLGPVVVCIGVCFAIMAIAKVAFPYNRRFPYVVR